MDRREWMMQAIQKLPALLIDDSAGVDNPWAWTTSPEIKAALERAYQRGDRGDALAAAWREAGLSPERFAEVEAELTRKAAAQAENKAKLEAVREALAAAAKARSERSPGGGAGASPREGADAPQKKTASKNIPEEEGAALAGEPGRNASWQAKAPAKQKQKSSQASAAAAASTLMKKFGEAIMREGFTCIPNVFLKNQKELKLSHLDMLLIVHLLSFWWEAAGFIWPSKATLAARVNAAECTVKRRIAKMEEMGLIKRVSRKGDDGGSKSNVYDLSGLLSKLEDLAQNGTA